MDINADLGEGYDNDAALLDIVSSANIACGGHYGDQQTMRRTVDLAIAKGVAIGAHPSYPDREGFGRRSMKLPAAQIRDFVAAQTRELMDVAARAGGRVVYVKPHGALGNLAAQERSVADAVVDALMDAGQDLAVLAMAGSALEASASLRGFQVCSEIYADRAYTPAGNLVPRSEAGAVIDKEEDAVDRLRKFLRSGHMPTATGSTVAFVAGSICVHGDNAHAVAFARAVKTLLLAEGQTVRSFCA